MNLKRIFGKDEEYLFTNDFFDEKIEKKKLDGVMDQLKRSFDKSSIGKIVQVEENGKEKIFVVNFPGIKPPTVHLIDGLGN